MDRLHTMMPYLRGLVTAPSERRKWLAGTFVGAVLVRLALYFGPFAAITIVSADSEEYIALAESLRQYGVFGFVGIPKMNRTPAYPAFLAAISSIFGSSPYAVMAVQIVLDALVCAMVVDLALRMRLNRIGVAFAAASSALCLYMAAMSAQMMSEGLFTPATIAAVWVLPTGGFSQLARRKSWWRLFLSGAFLGVGVLVRPPAVVAFAAMLACFGLGALWTFKRRAIAPKLLLGLAICTAGITVVVAPWLIRNRIVFADEYAKPNANLTAFGWKTEFVVYRAWYTEPYQHWLRSYEQPFVMRSVDRPPTVARWVYPGEAEEVTAAFDAIAPELTDDSPGDDRIPSCCRGTKGLIPIAPELVAPFGVIGDKRYEAAPRLWVTAPLSRLVRFWIAPRVSTLFNTDNGATIGMKVTVGFLVYNCLYVFPGLLGLALGYRRARVIIAAAVGGIVGQMALYSLWHASLNSRYTIPLFPFVCLGIGIFSARVSESGLRFWRSRRAAA